MQAESLIANRYRIERRIARGGQASVYLARQEHLDRKVALKVLTPPMGSDEEEIKSFEERFLLEAKTLATLDHPNIVTVYDYGQIEPGSFYIAMEFVEGQRFSALLREGPIAPTRALDLIRQVCSALRYAHQRKVIHRDIKNSNVLIRVDHHGREQVKVVDFGIAKLMEDDASLTMTGVVMGSPHFMAPEQARGITIDHRVDIYAVGVLLYCGLVGRYPFNGTSSREIVSAHISQEIPSFSTANPELTLPSTLEETVRRCLAKEPGERFQDIDTLLSALNPFLSEPDSMAMAAVQMPTDEESVADTERPKWVGMLLVGSALIALLPALLLSGILVYLVSQDTPTAAVSEPAPPAVVEPVEPEPVEPVMVPVEVEPEPVTEEPRAADPPTGARQAPTAPAASTPEAPSRPQTQPATPPADPLPSAAPESPPSPTPSTSAPEETVAPPSAWPSEVSDEGFEIEDNDLRNPWED